MRTRRFGELENMAVEEPVRLVCPECELVYKVKRLTLGKEYKCRQCGSGLRSLESVLLRCPSCGEECEREQFDPADVPQCPHCEAAPKLTLPGTVRNDQPAAASGESIATAVPTATVASSSGSSERSRSGGLSPESDLARLPRLIEDLTSRLELLRNVGIGDGGEPDDTAGRLLGALESLGENLDGLNGKLAADLDGMTGEVRELDAKISGMLEKMSGGELSALSEQVQETGSLFLSRLEEYREAQKAELAALLAPSEQAANSTTVEVDIDELSDRLVAGIRGRTLLDPETGSAVDALARVADELVREQSGNSSRMDILSTEIKNALSGISRMDEWRGELPVRVAEDISRMVEERVVGPVSTALSRQAPAILSDLQDNKLVDIVSRSVREAQRPLLREILAGGRGGVPAWLFASVLLPLLFVLGYLFLPGELGFGDNAAKLDGITDSVYRLESEGVPLAVETEEQIRNIEFAIRDINEKALAHAENAAALDERVKNLETELEEKKRLLKEYDETLSNQTKRLRLYENRLVQLGVSPTTIQ